MGVGILVLFMPYTVYGIKYLDFVFNEHTKENLSSKILEKSCSFSELEQNSMVLVTSGPHPCPLACHLLVRVCLSGLPFSLPEKAQILAGLRMLHFLFLQPFAIPFYSEKSQHQPYTRHSVIWPSEQPICHDYFPPSDAKLEAHCEELERKNRERQRAVGFTNLRSLLTFQLTNKM